MAGLRRLWVAELPAGGGTLELPRESVEHVQVLRLHAGAAVELFDARGGSATARLSRVARGSVECDAEPRRLKPAPSAQLHVLVGVPKAAKLETIVRMLTELGVASLHLLESERSVPKLGAGSAKLERLERIAREACAQSGQSYAPRLHPPRPLSEAVSDAPDGALGLAFWEEASEPLSSMGELNAGRQVWAVIGPEGGMSAAEAAALRERGFVLVRLGESILRVETACVAVSALLLNRLGLLG